MDIALGLVAGFLFALGSVLQQKAGLEGDSEGSSSSLLLRMARNRTWIAGIIADAFGFIAQAVALSIGRLAVVQPLLVSSVVFALPLGRRITGQRIRRRDISAATVVTGGLAVFLLVADPSGGRDDAPFGQWLICAGVCAALCTPLVIAARRASPGRRAALLGTATGVLFALSAALTKAVTDELGGGIWAVLTDWHLYALGIVGYVSMTLNQLALTTGVLAPAVATAMAFDPIASVVIGTTLLQESLHETTLGWIATTAALAAALAGMVVLARTQEGGPVTKPAGGAELGAARASAAR